jgi:protein-S-isoprenylcysteine O-methyltransferase Ste14
MKSMIILSVAFAISEFMLMLLKKSRSELVKNREDRGSLIFLWMMITLGFTAGFIFSKPVNSLMTGFGFTLIMGGLIIRWIAIIQLGSAFTVDVAINNGVNLKTDGIYERIRHPSYLGMLLVIIGFASAMYSLSSFIVLVIPVIIAVIYRISIEEKVLIKEFGDSYILYMKSTKKIIPGIF